MGKDFEILDHTADVGIIAYGADLRQAFANAARALFSLITELDDVAEVVHRDMELTASDGHCYTPSHSFANCTNCDKVITAVKPGGISPFR